MNVTTRTVKARELSALIHHYTIVWGEAEVVAARPGWGPQARHYTFYKLANDQGREHRIRGVETITVELTARTP